MDNACKPMQQVHTRTSNGDEEENGIEETTSLLDKIAEDSNKQTVSLIIILIQNYCHESFGNYESCGHACIINI